MMFVELPVGIADPLDRFDAVARSMAALKASHQAQAGVAVFEAAERDAAGTVRADDPRRDRHHAPHATAHRAHRHHQRRRSVGPAVRAGPRDARVPAVRAPQPGRAHRRGDPVVPRQPRVRDHRRLRIRTRRRGDGRQPSNRRSPSCCSSPPHEERRRHEEPMASHRSHAQRTHPHHPGRGARRHRRLARRRATPRLRHRAGQLHRPVLAGGEGQRAVPDAVRRREHGGAVHRRARQVGRRPVRHRPTSRSSRGRVAARLRATPSSRWSRR